MIGTDILAIARMQRLYEHFPNRVVIKILHKAEYDAFEDANDKARFLAKRWAAKEAIAKAIGTGLRGAIVMPAICITHDKVGAPIVRFDAKAQQLLDNYGIKRVAVSVSDEKEYVVAFSTVSY